MVGCTVAIPVFNQRAFIERAIHSALEQNLENLEILVLDNCSTDGTWEVIQKYGAQGVKLLRNTRNLGLFGNFNRCLEAGTSPYLRLLCGDDFLPKGCLATEVAVMQRHPGVAMVTTRGRFVDSQGKDLGKFADDFPAGIYDGRSLARIWLAYYVHYRRNPLNYPSGVMIRRAAAGGVKFDESYTTAGDIDFFLRLLQRGDLAVLDSLGSYVTRHASQSHAAPNLDGTAMQEHLRLYETLGDGVRNEAERREFQGLLGGMCLGLAIHRSMSRSTRDSAHVHFRLARSLAAGWLNAVFGLANIVLCRFSRIFLGYSAPYVPRSAKSLGSR